MKQEKGRTFNSISKSVKTTRSKLKQSTITTPIKNAPLTAKVNSTWNNVLNKNKGCTIGKISTSNKFEINLATNDPMKTMGLLIIELKNKMDTLLPGNRAVKNIIANISQTFSKMEQSFKIQNTFKSSKPVNSQISNLHSFSNDAKEELDIGKLQRMNEELEAKLKESMEENQKLRKENEDKESKLLNLKAELDSTIQRIEKLESTLNECVNTERETIANYEQQCKRLQNEIKTLQDSASQKGYSDHSTGNDKQKLDRMFAVDKFKCQIQMALKELEKEKLLTILKYDENQMMASYAEFCDVFELIQNYFTSDQTQHGQIVFTGHQSDIKKL